MLSYSFRKTYVCVFESVEEHDEIRRIKEETIVSIVIVSFQTPPRLFFLVYRGEDERG